MDATGSTRFVEFIVDDPTDKDAPVDGPARFVARMWPLRSDPTHPQCRGRPVQCRGRPVRANGAHSGGVARRCRPVLCEAPARRLLW